MNSRFTRGVTSLFHGNRTERLLPLCSRLSSVAPLQQNVPPKTSIGPRNPLHHLRVSPSIDMKGIDSVDEIIGKENVIIRNMHDFVKEIPRAVHLRKSENIEPGDIGGTFEKVATPSVPA